MNPNERIKRLAIIVAILAFTYLAFGFILIETMTNEGFFATVEAGRDYHPRPIMDKLTNIVIAPVALVVMVMFWLGGYRTP